ncbi:ABC transporter ATP-binding protein [Faecalitalea cylindroides]|uniref:ABC transporter ATP-binding protein n=1 Tax=Faecalitalea cylindroides TaxID=39483 RepID=A0AAW6FRH7_9FIRM|nr:ABC transporter ATP-binding protein [Faecalitalea cylindroides]MDC0827603.1 ABC transporter ATP-binding protein [Faecalitalea cylindroides]
MKLILKYLKKYKLLFLIDAISVFGFALVELGIPTLISRMIDQGVNTKDTSFLWSNWALMSIISIVGVCGTVILGYCSTRISTNVTRDIRNDVFEHAMTFSSAEMDKFGVSSMITRTNNDAYQIMLFLNVILRMALMTPVMMIVSIMLIVRISLPLSYIVLLTIPFILIGVFAVAKVSEPISENQQNSIDRINKILREHITGIRVIRSFNKEKNEEERFAKENRYYQRESSKLFKLMSCIEPTFFLLMNIAVMTVYFVSCSMLSAQTISIGDLIAFVEYIFHVMMSVLLFCMVFMMYPRANVSAKRIQAVLDTNSSIIEKENAYVCDLIESLTFDHVSFSYPDGEEAVLSDISFTCKKGEKIAVIGSTGSGKSSLVKLMTRLYDATKGQVLINGKDIKEYQLNSLRNQIGYVAQKAHLFKGSIKENISFGKPDATMDEIEEAAKIAQAKEFIEVRDHQYEDEISEDGTNVSGGQKQRLSIARAIIMDPSLYIYDDSFSALDFKTDAALREALKPKVKDAIFFVVAQRISTIMDADMILVLNDGKLVGKGTHKELMNTCKIYQEIALSQLSRKELMLDE